MCAWWLITTEATSRAQQELWHTGVSSGLNPICTVQGICGVICNGRLVMQSQSFGEDSYVHEHRR